jgi:hypothetical protein
MTDDLVECLREEQAWGNLLDGRAADRIEELERQLAEEKRYFKEVNEQRWDVHSRIFELERQLTNSDEALRMAILVRHTQEWIENFRDVIEKTRKVLEGKNDR